MIFGDMYRPCYMSFFVVVKGSQRQYFARTDAARVPGFIVLCDLFGFDHPVSCNLFNFLPGAAEVYET